MITLSQSVLFYFEAINLSHIRPRRAPAHLEGVDRRRLKTPEMTRVSHVPPAGKLCSATKVQDRHGSFDQVLRR